MRPGVSSTAQPSTFASVELLTIRSIAISSTITVEAKAELRALSATAWHNL